jgi:hypothetical protein
MFVGVFLLHVSTSNGKVEHMTQEVQRYLAGFRMKNYGANWERNLPLVEHVINATVSLSRGFSPFVFLVARLLLGMTCVWRILTVRSLLWVRQLLISLTLRGS